MSANKILKITFVILFFSLSKSHSVEDLSEFTDAINEATIYQVWVAS